MGKKPSEDKHYRIPQKLTEKNKKQGWERIDCPTCHGSGQYHFRTCGLCDGKGKITVHK